MLALPTKDAVGQSVFSKTAPEGNDCTVGAIKSVFTDLWRLLSMQHFCSSRHRAVVNYLSVVNAAFLMVHTVNSINVLNG